MKKSLSLFLALMLVLGCMLPAFAASETLSVYSSYIIPTDSVRMTAHRGYSAVAPENTLPSFKKAGEYGFWGAECDTSVTADGVWVIMHDDSVDRTTDGEGRIGDLTFDEIRSLTIDAGNNVEQYPNTKVPTLTEYLDVCKEFGMHPVIEIKECAGVENMESLARLLSSREEKDMFTIISFGWDICARIKELLPDTPVYILIGGAAEDNFPNTVQFAVENKLDGIDFAYVWGRDMVKLAEESGLKTMVWTLDDIESAERYYRWGVRDITTNSLTPTKPEGNIFQQILWALRDFLNSLPQRIESLFKAA